MLLLVSWLVREGVRRVSKHTMTSPPPINNQPHPLNPLALSTALIPSNSPSGVVGGSCAAATSAASAMWSGSTRCVCVCVCLCDFCLFFWCVEGCVCVCVHLASTPPVKPHTTHILILLPFPSFTHLAASSLVTEGGQEPTRTHTFIYIHI
jgi:hypothetical protein